MLLLGDAAAVLIGSEDDDTQSTAAAGDDSQAADNSQGYNGAGNGQSLGPAFQSTLQLLEWHRVCEHLADFASTHAGRRSCLALSVPATQQDSETLLQLTRAATVLEYDYATILDFGGVETQEAQSALRRAAKAGMCNTTQLKAVASVIQGGERLRKQVLVAARENNALGRGSPLAPLMPVIGALKPQPGLVRDIAAAIDDEGHVVDSASEALHQCRQRVRALQARLAGLLKGYGGEVSEKGGRACVALPQGSKLPPASMVLGTSPGGGLLYVEPPAAVAANNDLAAARGECYAAEEAVLYALTGRLIEVLPDMQETFRAVVSLDVLAAKARYGLWLHGVLPEFVPWSTIFHERGEKAAMQRMRLQQQQGQVQGGARGGMPSELQGSDGVTEGVRYAVRLHALRHPLLLGDYLKERARLERELRRLGVDPDRVAAAAGSKAAMAAVGSVGAGRANGLSARRRVLLHEYGLDAALVAPVGGTQGKGRKRALGDDGGAAQLVASLQALRPPVPLDLGIKPHTSAVVITGPNTGGKTATIKALGLACLMARAGLPLPCETPALLPAFTSVLADIGDEQSLTANLSTFSGHLRRIQALRAEANGKCLVLLDELGTGTDPLEGAALGVALLKRMAEGGVGAGALTVATTHHSIMTGLKFDDPQGRFENASVEFDTEALTPTYRLLWGIPGKSNALIIAARLGLDAAVVKAARGRLDASISQSDEAITQLEALRGQLQDEEVATWAVKQEVQALDEGVAALRKEVMTLQGQLAEAKAQALFEVWLEAKERLEKLRERKRLRSPPMPSYSASSSSTTAATTPGASTSSTKDLEQKLALLADELVSSSAPSDVTSAQQQLLRQQGPRHARSAVGGQPLLQLEDLVDARVDLMDLLDDLGQQRQKQQHQAREEAERYDRALESFEALVVQLPAPASADPSQQTSMAQEEDDEYDALAQEFETFTAPRPPPQSQPAPARPQAAPRSAPAAAPAIRGLRAADGELAQLQRRLVMPEDDVEDVVAELETLMSGLQASRIAAGGATSKPSSSPATARTPQEQQRCAHGGQPSAAASGQNVIDIDDEESELEALIAEIEQLPLPQPASAGSRREGKDKGQRRSSGQRRDAASGGGGGRTGPRAGGQKQSGQ